MDTLVPTLLAISPDALIGSLIFRSQSWHVAVATQVSSITHWITDSWLVHETTLLSVRMNLTRWSRWSPIHHGVISVLKENRLVENYTYSWINIAELCHNEDDENYQKEEHHQIRGCRGSLWFFLLLILLLKLFNFFKNLLRCSKFFILFLNSWN